MDFNLPYLQHNWLPNIIISWFHCVNKLLCVSCGLFALVSFTFLNNNIFREFQVVRVIEETGWYFAGRFDRILSIDAFILIWIINTFPANGIHNHRKSKSEWNSNDYVYASSMVKLPRSTSFLSYFESLWQARAWRVGLCLPKDTPLVKQTVMYSVLKYNSKFVISLRSAWMWPIIIFLRL